MRRLLLALTLALNVGTAAVGSAQTGNGVFPASWIFRNNFSVPDGPAYLMLGIQPQDTFFGPRLREISRSPYRSSRRRT